MTAMDMPTVVAVWNKWEWSTKAADKETEAIDVAEADNGLYHDHYFGYHNRYHCCCGC
jgi:hypothetical protein